MDQEHEMGNNHNNLVSSSNLIQLKEEDLTKLQNFKTARYVSWKLSTWRLITVTILNASGYSNGVR